MNVQRHFPKPPTVIAAHVIAGRFIPWSRPTDSPKSRLFFSLALFGVGSFLVRPLTATVAQLVRAWDS